MTDFLDENAAPVAQRVATHYIHRCSCGCSNYDYDSLAAKLQLAGLLDEKKRPEILKHIMKYLFSTYADTDILLQLKDDLSVFFRLLCDLTTANDIATDRLDVQDLPEAIQQYDADHTSG